MASGLSAIYGGRPPLLGGTGPFGIGHNSLLGVPPPGIRWAYVRPRFRQLLANLRLTENQIEDGKTKIKGVVSCLNRSYWNHSDGALNSVLIGSWAKNTRVRPPRDIDLHFILPLDAYYRFGKRQGNKQSQLLQEVRDVLRTTYPDTDIRGDRQVVSVPFGTFKIEVVPAFHRQGGGYLVCDTTGSGFYKHTDPAAELAALSAADKTYNGNVRKLTILLKQWQRECSVPIKSFQLEATIKGALPKLEYAGNDEFWFDWLIRNTLGHLVTWPCRNLRAKSADLKITLFQ